LPDGSEKGAETPGFLLKTAPDGSHDQAERSLVGSGTAPWPCLQGRELRQPCRATNVGQAAPDPLIVIPDSLVALPRQLADPHPAGVHRAAFVKRMHGVEHHLPVLDRRKGQFKRPFSAERPKNANRRPAIHGIIAAADGDFGVNDLRQ
jgi:hypothetical protein